MYGDDQEVLIYTYKNIGICYIGLGLPDRAEENYLRALEIMNACIEKSDGSEE